MAVSTPKALSVFGSCFTHAEEQSGRSWAFVAADHGGSFTDEGAMSRPATYRLQIRESNDGNELRLYSQPGSESAAVAKVIAQCR